MLIPVNDGKHLHWASKLDHGAMEEGDLVWELLCIIILLGVFITHDEGLHNTRQALIML